MDNGEIGDDEEVKHAVAAGNGDTGSVIATVVEILVEGGFCAQVADVLAIHAVEDGELLGLLGSEYHS